MGYPEPMNQSVERLEETREFRLKQKISLLTLQEKNQLLREFHPDYRDGAHRPVRIGVNKGDMMVKELADLLESRSLLEPREIDLQEISISVDALVIGSGGAGLTAALFCHDGGARVALATKLRLGDSNTINVAAKEMNCTVVGPNSVGILNPEDRVKLGAIGGDNVERCFVSGQVGVVSRSGGMTAECSWMVKQAGYGVSTSVSIGGDPLIGSSPKDILSLFETDPKTETVVMWGEPGTSYEEEVADFIEEGGYHNE
jgi:hypothetical protein